MLTILSYIFMRMENKKVIELTHALVEDHELLATRFFIEVNGRLVE